MDLMRGQWDEEGAAGSGASSVSKSCSSRFSSRPGRPPKKSPIFTSSATMAPSTMVSASGAPTMAPNNSTYPISGSVGGVGFGIGNTPATSDYPQVSKRQRVSESSTGKRTS